MHLITIRVYKNYNDFFERDELLMNIGAVCAKNFQTNWPFRLVTIWELLTRIKNLLAQISEIVLMITQQISCDGGTITRHYFSRPFKD